MKTMEQTAALVKLAVVSGIVIGGVAGVAAWHLAPPVGGEFWPYIRAVVSIVAGYIAAQIAIGVFGVLAV